MIWSLQLVVGSVISPVLAHLLGPSEFGALALAISVYQLFSVLAFLGIGPAITLQRAEDTNDRAARGLITVGIVVSFVVTGTLALTSPLWRDALGFGDHVELLYIVFLWTASGAAVQLILALLVTEDRFRIFAIVSGVASVGGQIIGILLMLFVHKDATTYAWGAAISQFVAMGIGVIAARPRLAGLLDFRVAGRAIRLGLPLAIAGLSFFVLNAGDRLVIQGELGVAQVGRYQIAYVVGSVILLMLGFMDSAWTPRLAQERDLSARWALAAHSRDELYRLLVPSILGITLAAPLVLRIVASASYHPSGLLLVVFLVAVSAFPVVSSDSMSRLLTIERRGVSLGINTAIAAVVNIILNLALVPVMGIDGSALATLLSFALLALLNRLRMPRQPCWPWPPPRLIVAMSLAIASSAVTLLLPQTEFWNIARFIVAAACLPWFIIRLRRARQGPAVPAGRSHGSDRKRQHMTGASVHNIASNDSEPQGPGPFHIVNIEVDEAPPTSDFDSRYTGVMLVAWRKGHPLGATTVEFAALQRPVEEEISEFIERMRLVAGNEPPQVADADLPSISVVIPTIVERIEGIELLLTSLGKLDYPKAQFLIVDNRRIVPEDDQLPKLVSLFPRARVVRAARPGISAARNAGLEAAGSDIVVFTDDDVAVEANWLRSIGGRFVREPGLVAVTGLILPAELETSAQIWFERYYGGFAGERLFEPATVRPKAGKSRALRNARANVLDRAGNVTGEFAIYGVGAYGSGANMAVRRSAVQRVGNFNLLLGSGTPSRGGEDLAILINLLWDGGSIGYEPSAVVHHTHRRAYAELLRQLHGYGVGFISALTSLVVGDPRHLLSIGSQVPVAIVAMARKSKDRLVISRKPQGASAESQDPPYPRKLVTTELGGYISGLFAYAKSARTGKRWQKTAAEPPN